METDCATQVGCATHPGITLVSAELVRLMTKLLN